MCQVRSLVGIVLAGLVLLSAGLAFTDNVDRYRKAAERGDADAQYRLGNAYYFGDGVPTDHAEAAKWYRMAGEQGHIDAQTRLGEWYIQGLHGLPEDHAEAAKWFYMAAEQGDRGARNQIGRMFANGWGLPQDHAEAAKWYRMAGEQGHIDAQFNLGEMYRLGNGIPQDHAEAAKWYRMAAQNEGWFFFGPSIAGRAQYRLAFMLERGIGVPQDLQEALRWFRKAAIEEDNEDALKRYRVVAGDGNVEAQYDLAVWYGEDSREDMAESLRWYEMAATQGHVDAQYALGVIYVNGKGTVQANEAEAAKWFRMAAEQGHVLAKINLARLPNEPEEVEALQTTGSHTSTTDPEEVRAWNRIKHLRRGVAHFEAFLKDYPNGQFAAEARQRLEELLAQEDQRKARSQTEGSGAPTTDPEEVRAWNRIKHLRRGVAHFEAFLKDYPNGQFAAEARQRLGELLAQEDQREARSQTEGSGASTTDPEEVRAWNRIKHLRRGVAHFEAFLKDYPNGQFAAEARQRLGELLAQEDQREARSQTEGSGAPTTDPEEVRAWNRILRTGAEHFEAFLKDYPNGQFAAEARQRLEELLQAAEKGQGGQ